MKYFANFDANCGTHYDKDIDDTNKQRLIKTINNIANENRYKGNKCRWYVRDEKGQCVAAGYTLPNGQRYRIHNECLKFFEL